ncbi:MAG: polyamine aminopropyltransferase [Anaerolineae bacterium]|nr:polyamine aminopropyltransferase [Anaerolineae bacterium]
MPLSTRHSTFLLVTVFVIAVCGLVYELLIGTLSSYLFGNSVTHFSITIGLFLSAMGLGSFASRRITASLLGWFIAVELAVGLIGGFSAALLYAVFATTDLYYVVMVGLILIIGSLIGMEIPLLTRLLGGWGALKDTLANVLAFDYLGALIASVLFPIVLLPELGLLKTAFATGLLNIGVVVVNIWMFHQRLPTWRALSAITAGTSVCLLLGMAWSIRLTSFFEQQLYQDEIIYTDQTPYQRIIITRWAEDVRLYLDGNLQFSSRDEYRYHEPLVHPAMSLSRSRESVLVLGGGDGLVAREVFKYDDVQRLVLVDIDPAMTDLAMSHPAILAVNGDSLRDPRLKLVNEDAYNYLVDTDELFGVIIIDLPDPNNESLGKLYSREFYKLVQRHLAKGGVVVSQATSPYFARETFWSIVHTAADVGLKTWPYHVYVPSFGDWGFFLAAEHQLDLSHFAPLVPVRFFSAEVFATSLVFDSDISELETQVNTLDNQIILTYYEQGWRRWD